MSRQGGEDIFGRSAVSANDNDVAVAFGVLGEGSRHTFPYTLCASHKGSHRVRGMSESSI